jgi:hypothetical protein
MSESAPGVDSDIEVEMSDYAGPEVWHEAGHALAALHLGGEVRLVTLESEFDDHAGHTAVAWSGFAEEERTRRSALVALAGPVAETLYVGEDVEDPAVLATWRADWEEAEACLRRLAEDPEERGVLRQRLLAELVGLFRDERVWEQLARIVDALDAYETLDADMIEDALG